MSVSGFELLDRVLIGDHMKTERGGCCATDADSAKPRSDVVGGSMVRQFCYVSKVALPVMTVGHNAEPGVQQ